MTQALRVSRGDFVASGVQNTDAMKPHDLKVSDLMTTAVMTINSSEPLAEARVDMDVGWVRHLPVVDERNRLVGIVSDRDIARRADKKRICDVMSRDVVTTRPEAPAHQAASMMLDFRIGSLPVVDDDGALVGMVTLTDYVALARRALLGLPLER